ncbi:hypothetical protein MRX96_023907 [Rhipicephalus microplus]
MVCSRARTQRPAPSFRIAADETRRAVHHPSTLQERLPPLHYPETRDDDESCSSSEKAQGNCYGRSAASIAQVKSSPAHLANKLAATGNLHTPIPRGRPSDTGTVNVIHSGELRSRFLEVDKQDKDCTTSKKSVGDCYGGAARMSYQTLGIQEFHIGPRGLIPLFRDPDLKTKIVLCNVDFSRDHVLTKLPKLPTRSTILTVDNLKVGIVRLRVRSLTIIINDPLESLRNESKKLRDEGCHVVIAIGGGDPNEDRTLADSLTDITAFVVKYQGRFAYPSTATEKHGLDFEQDLDYPIKLHPLDRRQASVHIRLYGPLPAAQQVPDDRADARLAHYQCYRHSHHS